MTAVITGIKEFLLAALVVAPNLIITIAGILLIYSVYQWWNQRKESQKDERSHRTRIEKLEEQKITEQKKFNEYIMRANDRQDKTLEGLDKALTMLNMTFEKVSDKLSGHDERSNAIYTEMNMMRGEYAREDSVKRVSTDLKNIQKTMVHKDDFDRLEGKIDELSRNMPK